MESSDLFILVDKFLGSSRRYYKEYYKDVLTAVNRSNPNSTNRNGETLVHYLCRKGFKRVKIVKNVKSIILAILPTYDMNIVDHYKRTALDVLCIYSFRYNSVTSIRCAKDVFRAMISRHPVDCNYSLFLHCLCTKPFLSAKIAIHTREAALLIVDKVENPLEIVLKAYKDEYDSRYEDVETWTSSDEECGDDYFHRRHVRIHQCVLDYYPCKYLMKLAIDIMFMNNTELETLKISAWLRREVNAKYEKLIAKKCRMVKGIN